MSSGVLLRITPYFNTYVDIRTLCVFMYVHVCLYACVINNLLSIEIRVVQLRYIFPANMRTRRYTPSFNSHNAIIDSLNEADSAFLLSGQVSRANTTYKTIQRKFNNMSYNTNKKNSKKKYNRSELNCNENQRKRNRLSFFFFETISKRR